MLKKNEYIIDNHTHLNIEPLYDDWKNLAQKCKDMKMFLNLASSEPIDVERGIEIARATKIANVLMAIHPTEVNKYDMNDINTKFEKYWQENKDIIVGIGECGLDQKHPDEYPSMQKQIAWLKWHADFANRHNLPIMLHMRMAYDVLLEKWDEFNFKTTVIIHCFTGTSQQAQALLDKGCYISFAGLVTHVNAAKEWGDESIKVVPLSRIFVETDAPFLTPRTYRNKTEYNIPCYITETYEYIAKIKNIGVSDLLEAVNQNYKDVYGKDKLGYKD